MQIGKMFTHITLFSGLVLAALWLYSRYQPLYTITAVIVDTLCGMLQICLHPHGTGSCPITFVIFTGVIMLYAGLSFLLLRALWHQCRRLNALLRQ